MTNEVVPDKNPHTSNKPLIFALLGSILILRLSFVFLLPFGQATKHHLEGLNDEPAHFNYVKYLAVNRSFPVLTHWVLEKDAFVRNEFEYHQAPLYYLLCVPVYLLLGKKGALIPCRILSALFGVLCVGVVALIFRDLGCSKTVQAGAAIFAGFLFSHVYFSSLVSNDALSWLLAALVTRELLNTGGNHARLSVRPMARSIGILILWCAAGLLTKSSFLIFLPVVFGVYVCKSIRAGTVVPLFHGVLVTGVSGMIAFPWYLRNLHLYHSLTGMPAPSATAALSPAALIGCTKGMIRYFWFPMQNLEGGTVTFTLLTVIGAAVLTLHFAAAVRWIGKKQNVNGATILLGVLLLVNAAASFWYYLQWQNPEARFLFPALGSIVVVMVVPVYDLLVRIKRDRLFIPYIFAAAVFPYAFLPFAK
jgi:hypothetical protein